MWKTNYNSGFEKISQPFIMSTLTQSYFAAYSNTDQHTPEDDQSTLIKTFWVVKSSVHLRATTDQKRDLITRCLRKPPLIAFYTMRSFKSYLTLTAQKVTCKSPNGDHFRHTPWQYPEQNGNKKSIHTECEKWTHHVNEHYEMHLNEQPLRCQNTSSTSQRRSNFRRKRSNFTHILRHNLPLMKSSDDNNARSWLNHPFIQ